MIFLHTLLFFLLGISAMAFPVPTISGGESTSLQYIHRRFHPFEDIHSDRRLTGYWGGKSVSEHCTLRINSFSCPYASV